MRSRWSTDGVERLLSLDAGEARDPHIAGSKAAGLARARSAGLPALPGWVVPADSGDEAARAGTEALRRSGPAAACLAVADLDLDAALRRDLEAAADAFGGSAIVRSSSKQEADPRWAGAFATYLDVAREDLPTAVRGCWASAFSRDVVARSRTLGVPAGQLGVAVLLQPWRGFDGGGTATLRSDGGSRVTAITGPPAELVGGRRAGVLAEVGPDGSVSGDAGLDGLGPGILAGVAALAREVARTTGDDAIEWGVIDGMVVLLQTRRATRADVVPGPRRRRIRPIPPAAEHVARLAARFPAPLGDRLVLPWALSLDAVPEVPAIALGDPRVAPAEARRLAEALTLQAWGGREAAASEVAATFRALLGPEPDVGLARLAGLRPVDRAPAIRLLGLVAAMGDELAARGRLPLPEQVWRLSLEELERAMAPRGGTVPARLGPDRWEPFVFETVRTRGRSRPGTPAAPGIGAGRLFPLSGRGPWALPHPRGVLAVRDPVPQVAPLLWNCAGLVTASGSVGAHLFEVARSLAVPAVVGVDLLEPNGPGEGALVAVDGDAGEVSVLLRDQAAEGRRKGA